MPKPSGQRWWWLAIVVLLAMPFVATTAMAEDSESDSEFDADQEMVELFVYEYCVACHNETDKAGELSLDFDTVADVTKHPDLWERIVRKVNARQMPPVGEDRPDESTFNAFTRQVCATLDAEAQRNPRPGRTETFRRLNRTEYQNAIRDLLALDIDAAALLPADEASHGFDNVTVGDLPPTLLTRYVNAARKIARQAVAMPSNRAEGYTYRIRPDVTQEQHVPGLPLGTRGGLLVTHTFNQPGEYEVAVTLTRDRNEHVEGLKEPHEMVFLVNRQRVASIQVNPPKNKQRYYFDDNKLKTRIHFDAGPQQLGVTFVQNKSSLIETKRQPLNVHFNVHRHPRQTPAIYQVSITGPLPADSNESNDGEANGVETEQQETTRVTDANAPSTETSDRTQLSGLETPSRRRIFIVYPESKDQEIEAARQIIAHLTRLAYRRTVNEDDLRRPMEFFQSTYQEHGFEAGIEMALSAILVSPRFLFRIERDPQEGTVESGKPYRINDFELASRLSFFLWSSIPDDELLRAAESGQLRDRDQLRHQVDRMLRDPRSSALVTNFASQWLYLRNLESKVPDARLYPDFDDNLRQAFRKETEMLFEHVMRGDRSVLELLTADYTFLNERLAKHYGIDHVYGSRFRRVGLDADDHRGGLLRHGSILTVTSYATRTSPVIRGNWILENILGTPAPPPPPNVPALEEKISTDLPMRERLARHRADPACASCHELMDPVGFALENYDAVGRWRDQEAGRPVDVSGGLPDGSQFEGVEGLEQAILKRPELFVAAITEKMLTYALGRGIEPYDGPAVRAVVRQARDDDYRFSALIWGIVTSPPFQMRTSQ